MERYCWVWGLYQISSIGRVKSFYNGSGKILTPYKVGSGYLQIMLCKNTVQKKFYIHRLVSSAYLINPLNKTDINHKDGVKSNNIDTNLEWVTKSENSQHAYDNGLMNNPLGINHHSSKLNPNDVYEIRKIGNRLPLRQLSEMYGVNMTNIRHILIGKIWKHTLSQQSYV